ncbi:hypothetical protein AB685_29125 [Bacillus sp. LL01]|uniref:tripartite tricarboxylate transporter TctB family protein n=1 Tax=Bacillus sp. LL01 TaxID=1665556 RepID=UPI00064D3764|nr:tripartite tricarboxylate transporter TctB family protein [Bacillus sp. LL01]KMJ55083.1 hypothetical protein AB685_29125 [Bacillus sp. LL01]
MEFERVKDIIVSVLILGISALFFVNTRSLIAPADIFPKVVILIFSMLGLFLLIKALFLKSLYHESDEDNDGLEDEGEINQKRRWISMGSILAYVLLMPIVGFYITSGIFLLLMSIFLIGKKPTVKGSIMPVIMSTSVMCILYFTFSFFLRVPVPSGILF